MQLFQGVELPQEAFCVRTFGLPEIRGSCLSLGRLPINRGCCPLSHWSCVSWAGFGWIVSRPHSSQLCQEGFGGIGEVGQHHWPRLLNKGEARLSLGGMERERQGERDRERENGEGVKLVQGILIATVLGIEERKLFAGHYANAFNSCVVSCSILL